MTNRRSLVDTKAPATPPRFLSGLSQDQSKVILKTAEPLNVRGNHVIVNAGDRATQLFLLMKGRIKYYHVTSKGDEVLLWLLAPGDTFGIGTVLAPQAHYIGTAETVDDCELLVWSGKKIRQLAGTHRILAENALRIVMHYLMEYTDRLAGVVFETAEYRLSRTLIRLASQTGRVQPGGVEFAITNEHLAGLSDVSPFTASRQLQLWERDGIVQKTRGKIRIISPENLLID